MLRLKAARCCFRLFSGFGSCRRCCLRPCTTVIRRRTNYVVCESTLRAARVRSLALRYRRERERTAGASEVLVLRCRMEERDRFWVPAWKGETWRQFASCTYWLWGPWASSGCRHWTGTGLALCHRVAWTPTFIPLLNGLLSLRRLDELPQRHCCKTCSFYFLVLIGVVCPPSPQSICFVLYRYVYFCVIV